MNCKRKNDGGGESPEAPRLHTLDELPYGAVVSIYGAGNRGRALRALIAEYRPDVGVARFIDTFKRGHFDGLDVTAPEGVFGPILVASDYWKDIAGGLRRGGVKDFLVTDHDSLMSAYGFTETTPTDAGSRNPLTRGFATPPGRPCHYYELFVRSDGAVFPCCNAVQKGVRIGHIDDLDLYDKIDAFHGLCSCERFHIRSGAARDEKRYFLLNVEMSLLCNSRCPMCIVGSPSWRGRYDLYDALGRMIERLRPLSLVVQGGEILVQRPALRWMEGMRERYPEMNTSVLTNGAVGERMVLKAEGLFDRIMVSMYGAQEHTYRVMTGLKLARVKNFAEAVAARRKSLLTLKYLTTPINIHESSLFLGWAIGLSPERILFADSDLNQYIRLGTFDDYWAKIFDRTGEAVRAELISGRDAMIKGRFHVVMDGGNRERFKLDDAFIGENGLEGLVITQGRSRSLLFGQGSELM